MLDIPVCLKFKTLPKIWNVRHNPPKGVIYCGRGTPFGNPFKMRDYSLQERNRVCNEFIAYVYSEPHLIDYIKKNLRGKDLSCHCAPQRCHCETLIKIANSE